MGHIPERVSGDEKMDDTPAPAMSREPERGHRTHSSTEGTAPRDELGQAGNKTLAVPLTQVEQKLYLMRKPV